jgi:hypothetical protein
MYVFISFDWDANCPGYFLDLDFYRLWVERGGRKERKGTYVSWTDDGTVPVGHENIVAVLEAIGA